MDRVLAAAMDTCHAGEDAVNQLKQGVYLTEQELTLLGTDEGQRGPEPAECGAVPHRPTDPAAPDLVVIHRKA